MQVGRPVLWGLAVNGEAGVRHVLELLRNEFDLAMAICGCHNVARDHARLNCVTMSYPPTTTVLSRVRDAEPYAGVLPSR